MIQYNNGLGPHYFIQSWIMWKYVHVRCCELLEFFAVNDCLEMCDRFPFSKVDKVKVGPRENMLDATGLR
jgi:hypothetical protein